MNRSSASSKPWETAKGGSGSTDDPLAVRFVASLGYDRRLYHWDIIGSLAHARMLAACNFISKHDLEAIADGLGCIELEIDEQGEHWPGWRSELEDVHMCIETALIEKVGDPGRKLHTGRSRNDQVALDVKLWIEDAADKLQTHFDQLFRAFIELAQRDGEIVMPSYTHLQRAQPIVVGGELMAWLAALDRCQRRITALRTVNKRNPLGSGAIAGSALGLDRDHTAGALGVGPPTVNSIDATATRDSVIDFVYSLSMTSVTLSRWAEQWIIYASGEFGFIRLDPRYTTGSSMMPQKRNPDMLELIRGRTGGIFGSLVALLTMCKGISLGYNRDLQEDKRYLFSAYDTVSDMMAMATRIVATVQFDEAAISPTLGRGFLDATSCAEYLVTRGVAFRTAHQIVGKLVRQCENENIEQLSQLTLKQLQTACDKIDENVYQWLGAHSVVKGYRTAGNAGLTGFQNQLQAWQHRLQ